MLRNIYYLCPRTEAPCGGVQKIYQHVDILNQNGFNAYVLHPKKGFRYRWRKNKTKIAYLEPNFRSRRENASAQAMNIVRKFLKKPLSLTQTATLKDLTEDRNICCLMDDNHEVYLPKFDQQDVIVFNDYIVPTFESIIGKFPSVILNFTCYTTFNGISIQDSLDRTSSLPYDQRSLACIVGSKDTENYLRFVFPELTYHICPFGVDTEQFIFHAEKERKIAFMPRKCSDHLVQVISILKQRNKFPNWSFVALENMSQEQLINEMRSSALFLSTSYLEGLGLPPAEALSTGALVVGYDGEGGKEFFHPPFAHAIPHGNIIGFVKKVEEMMALFENDRELFIQIGKMGSDFIASRYSIAEENRSIVEVWNQIAAAKSKMD